MNWIHELVTPLARLLIFPGLLFAVPAAWFFLWVERKAVALMQGRVGPPFMQPFFDFIKLLGKSTPPRSGVGGLLMRAWPLIAVSAAAGAVGLLPVLPSSGGFEGDLILLLALLELPSMCIIAAGFSSRSIFGEIGSAREAVLSVAYNVVFLLAIVSIAASQHTFRLESLAALPASPMRWLGVLALLVCLPAKLHLNPFSLPNAEQEIYSGPMVEYAGPELAMWELSHGLEWVAATGLVATLAAPYITLWWLAALVFVGLMFAIVLALSTLASATARLAIDTTVRFYWQCTLIFAVLAVSSALFMRLRSLTFSPCSGRTCGAAIAPCSSLRAPRLARAIAVSSNSIPSSAPDAPSANSAARRAPSSSKPPKVNLLGATIPVSAPSAAAALKAVQSMRSKKDTPSTHSARSRCPHPSISTSAS